ncbi:Major facilitator superfamily [Dillenia turbinata]|uniref:Major facilitator superfamily n=1 Tax=Dillenia turbinata TaxID=194707 RepID=A0AAN8ZIL2_9MAGN
MGSISRLSHLFMTVFLHNFSTYMVIPAITDVTMSALCPGQDECSIAIYLTGFQQVVIGLGTLVMMPLVGNLSDKYGRKALITLPMTLAITPLAILAYSRTRNFFYFYFVLKTLTAMVCEGSVHCLALAYVADNIPEGQRVSAFGILTGIGSASFVCGTLATHFLSTSSTFQVAATVAILGLVYMRIFLPESIIDSSVSTQPLLVKEAEVDATCSNSDAPAKIQVIRPMPSLGDMLSLLKTSPAFSQAAIVAFFNNLGDVGLHTSLMYYLKASFHFNKDQFADLMLIAGIAGTISQFLLMPILGPALGEEKLLSIGLLFSCTHMFLYAISWCYWVPYAAAMFSILMVFSSPCLNRLCSDVQIRSIASKQVGPSEQGKAQGCISGIMSIANVISPLAFTPLTALFLSDAAPFHFPGFSIMCAGFASTIAFLQSTMIRAEPNSLHKASSCGSLEA